MPDDFGDAFQQANLRALARLGLQTVLVKSKSPLFSGMTFYEVVVYYPRPFRLLSAGGDFNAHDATEKAIRAAFTALDQQLLRRGSRE